MPKYHLGTCVLEKQRRPDEQIRDVQEAVQMANGEFAVLKEDLEKWKRLPRVRTTTADVR